MAIAECGINKNEWMSFWVFEKPMVEKQGKRRSVMINRAPVLTLWAAVVAEMLGFDYDEALTLGPLLQA